MGAVNLTDEQKATIAGWVDQGADLNQLQDRLRTELGVTLTFMDTRFLIADLGLKPKPPANEDEGDSDSGDPLGGGGDEVEDESAGTGMLALDETSPAGAAAGGSVKVVLDEIAVPGALASGKVTFSDGKTASWFLDQMGRLGFSGVDRSYQPAEADVMVFQRELQSALRRAGY